MLNTENIRIYWPKRFTYRAIFFSFIVVTGISLYFSDFYMPPVMYAGGMLIIISFFVGLEFFQYKWRSITSKPFYYQLFYFSLLFRIIGLLYMMLITSLFNPNRMMEIAPADTWTYHNAGMALRELFLNGKWDNYLEHFFKDKSDWGFGIYSGLVYMIFGPYVIVHRLMNCIWGSFTVVLIAKIAEKVLSFDHAKLSGILAMLMPPLIWFSSQGLKETFMIFMVVSIFYYAISFVEKGRIHFWGIFTMVMFTFFLFFFRTVMGLLVITIVLSYLGLNLFKRKRAKIIVIVTFILFVSISGFLIYQAQFFESILSTYEQSATRREDDWTKSTKDLKINIRMAVVAPLAFAGAIITPLPSFLMLEKRQEIIIAHYQNEMVRNILYYFAFLGLFFLFRNNFARSSIILLFPLCYIFILATAGVGFQDRFVLPSLPFFIILISVGLINGSPRWIKRYDYYLFIILIAQIAWNVFKLSNRGLI